MKLRLRSNSIRIRLTKTEVSTLSNTGYLETSTSFGSNRFNYALQCVDTMQLTATLADNKITVFIPASKVKGWPENEVVGFNDKMPVGNGEFLSLLVEKDFVCLDETDEDQSDNYINPKSNC